MGDCIYLEKCPIFALFRQQAVKNIFIAQYCESNWEKCERKKLRDKGEEIPGKLLPNGQYLP
ncbi:MAG: hypothetical protein JW738_10380 [Actinobacteria bacterium]|nr:hypothetical protein [Actinomycetota bacterium]